MSDDREFGSLETRVSNLEREVDRLRDWKHDIDSDRQVLRSAKYLRETGKLEPELIGITWKQVITYGAVALAAYTIALLKALGKL